MCVACESKSMHWMAASGPLLFHLHGVQSHSSTIFHAQTAADPRPAICAITQSALVCMANRACPLTYSRGGRDLFCSLYIWVMAVCALGGKLMGEGEVGVVQASSSSVNVYILQRGQKHAWRREMGRGRGSRLTVWLYYDYFNTPQSRHYYKETQQTHF